MKKLFKIGKKIFRVITRIVEAALLLLLVRHLVPEFGTKMPNVYQGIDNFCVPFFNWVATVFDAGIGVIVKAINAIASLIA